MDKKSKLTPNTMLRNHGYFGMYRVLIHLVPKK